ncbi:MAG: hypothetical protein ACYSWU_23215, partial [Planctomycetota bacterium]
MKIDDASLQQLLRAAGRSEAPPPGVPPDLADRVRRLRAHRHRTRRALGGLLAASVLLAGATGAVYYAVGPRERADHSIAEGRKAPQAVPAPSPEDDVQRLRAEIAALAAEARRRERVIEEVTRRQRLREQIARLEKPFNQPDPLEVVRLEIEKTAFLLVSHAETRSSSS